MLTMRARRAGLAMTIGLGLVLAAAQPAAGHVTVHPDSEPAGTSFSVLTFRVPNEMDDARTVKVKIFLPTDTPVTGVLVRPVAGWQVRMTTKKLAHPIRTPGGRLDVVPWTITWSGGSVPVGGYQDFEISVGHVPDQPGPLIFKALQTYSNGKVVRWIETAPPGSPEPEHPAPTVQLTAPHEPASSDTGTSNGTDRGLAIAGLAVALVALWVAVAGRVRRTSS
ncbi:MAG TPA: YcnI family protein [Mycobacteriales bacterium]|nr:YcnI family protein [Mycobacteriales bacterium]